MTNKLSPAAQAVLDAAEPCVWPDECPGLEAAIAAALRAAANQLRVAYQNEEYVDPADDYLYSIAAELEAR